MEAKQKSREASQDMSSEVVRGLYSDRPKSEWQDPPHMVRRSQNDERDGTRLTKDDAGLLPRGRSRSPISCPRNNPSPDSSTGKPSKRSSRSSYSRRSSSKSTHSRRSRSRSRNTHSRKSRSRSRSTHSRRSRSRSRNTHSRKSRSRSRSTHSRKSRSRSKRNYRSRKRSEGTYSRRNRSGSRSTYRSRFSSSTSHKSRTTSKSSRQRSSSSSSSSSSTSSLSRSRSPSYGPNPLSPSPSHAPCPSHGPNLLPSSPSLSPCPSYQPNPLSPSPSPSYGADPLPSSKYFGDVTSESNYSMDEEDEEYMPRTCMEFNCEVCGISTTSFQTLQTHFAGAKHQKNLRKVGYGNTFKSVHEVRDPQLSGKILRCILCDVILTEAEVGIHVACETHVNALKKVEERFKDMDPDKWFDEVTKKSKNLKDGYKCTLCVIALPTLEGFRMHIRGKRHQKAVKLATRDESVLPSENSTPVWCQICNIYCTNQESLDLHLRGKRHLKTLKNKGFVDGERSKSLKTASSSGASNKLVTNPFIGQEHISETPQIRCTLCDVVLSSNTAIHAHLSTTEHYVALRAAPDKRQKDLFVPVSSRYV